jgi:hypothetical protein
MFTLLGIETALNAKATDNIKLQKEAIHLCSLLFSLSFFIVDLILKNLIVERNG